jgi:4,5-DOPA dioxygenase extradiol
LQSRNHAALIDFQNIDPQAQLAIPTSEHYLPLLYIAALQADDDKISFPTQGIEMGTLSMLSVRVG